MKKNKIILLSAAFVIFPLIGQAQTVEQLNKLDSNYKTCLDKGTNMVNCSSLYYSQMDSLLNVAYNNLRRPLDQTGKTALKNEQIKWLKKRDIYFKQVDKEYADANSNGFGGNDSRMIAIDEKAQFVRARVEELIKKQKKKLGKANHPTLYILHASAMASQVAYTTPLATI